MLVFALGVLWMSRILAGESREAAPLPSELGRAEIGIIDQPLFAQQKSQQEIVRELRHRLQSYGWVDRERGIIHVPIERAIELYLAGARPEGHPHAPEGGHQH